MALISCPQCQKSLTIGREVIGKKIRCPVCQHIFLLEGAHFKDVPPVAVASTSPPEQRVQTAAPRKLCVDASPPTLHDRIQVGKAIPPPPLPPAGQDERSTGRIAIPGFTFCVVATSDTAKALRGTVKVKVTEEGARILGKYQDDDLNLPIGSDVTHDGRQRLICRRRDEDGIVREVVITITQQDLYKVRFARDLAAFLRGERPALRKRDYVLTNGMKALAGMPLLVALIAISLNVSGNIPPLTGLASMLWGAFWGLIGGLLSVAAYYSIQYERFTRSVRSGMAIGLTIGGLLLLVGVSFLFKGSGGSGLASESTWNSVFPPGGKASVMMPGVPATQHQGVPGIPGHILVYVLNVPGKDQSFALTQVEIPAHEWDRVSLEDRFLGARAGMLATTPGATLESEKVIETENCPGREWVMDIRGKGKVMSRGIFVGRNFYVITASGRGFSSETADVRRFLDSFKLTRLK